MIKRLAIFILMVLLIGTSGYYGLLKPQPAKAQIENFTILDIQRWIEFFQVEAQKVTKDEIRQIVIKEVTKKMIEKIIGGQQGGIAGGGSAFVDDYYRYLYTENEKDTRRYVDNEFDRLFPSYIDPSIKKAIKDLYDQNARLVPDNCVDARTINFAGDPDAANKLAQAAQFGCNEISAQLLLDAQARGYDALMQKAAELELQSNQGLVNKDEDSNPHKQSGVVYSGVIQGALAAVYNVQVNNESAISSVIGAFVDQLLDEILDQQY
ncbi:MAG: hypothetical protein U0517_03810 [Candidatus Andersenbacteria bacterium]